jgi:two-component system CheB/CheR fusion protein
MMAEILSRQTRLPVQEVVTDTQPLPNVIYTVPPGFNLVFQQGRFCLSQPSPEVAPKPSINLLFQSMAQEFDERAIGIILSGTGADGTRGLLAIKAAGGISFVQTPESAKYDGMPRAAIEAGVADYIAPPAEICFELKHLLRWPDSSAGLDPLEHHPNQLSVLLERVRQHTRIDFSNYKLSTVQRRLQRRMIATKTSSPEAYLAYTEAHPAELNALARETLISVTEFFRDKEAFAALAPLLRGMILRKPPGAELRLWVVGCATGEEAYSLTILCRDLMQECRADLRLQVFATDIDSEALAVARRGIYTQAALADLPADYVKRYFKPGVSGYEVVKSLRDGVIFARQDIAADASFLKLDLVSCRNLLIYFNAQLQARVLSVIHRALQSDGLLFLGRAETVSQQEDLFEQLDLHAKIFRTRQTIATKPSHKLVRGQLKRHAEGLRPVASTHEMVFLKALAERLGPAMLVDSGFRILHSHGEVARFIRLPTGTPEMNLAQLIVPEFADEFVTTLYRAQRRNTSAYSRKRRLESRANSVWRLAIHPVVSPDDNALFLVVFESAAQLAATPVSPAQGAQDDGLDAELASTRDHLKSVVEEIDHSHAEMESLNEELQAANEELQATNEELLSVNEESQNKSAELAAINSDFESLYNTVDFPVLLLDTELLLKRANSAAIRSYDLSYDLSLSVAGKAVSRLNLPSQLRHIEQRLCTVIASARKETFAAEFDGRSYQVLVSPVLNHTATVQGVVLVVIDNTDLTLAQQRTRESQQRLLSIMNHSMALISVKDAAGCYEFVNHRFEATFARKAADVIGKTDQQLFDSNTAQLLRSADLEVMWKKAAVESTDGIVQAGGTLWLQSIRFPIFDADGTLRSICTQANDVTHRHRADQQLRLAAKVFERAGEAIVVTDAHGTMLSVNQAFTQVTGYSADEVIGSNPRILSSGQHADGFYQAMWRSLNEQGGWQGEIINRRKNGELYPQWLTISAVKNDDGQLVNYVAMFSDISSLKLSQQRIEFLATHDDLTGLPNRSLLMDRLKQALLNAQRQQQRLAVLFIDLDNFKNINDTLGHDVGDMLLNQATGRLKQCVRDADTLARLGGDEFVAILGDIELQEINTVATRIVDSMATSFVINARPLHVSASIGISIFPEDGDDSISLLKNADTAMYRAKDRGRNQYQFFVDEMKVIALQRMTLESGLRLALDAGHLRMVYQPKVDLHSGLVVGAEALLRWRDPVLGDVSPAQFIPVAEGCGLIAAVGNRVFDMVLGQIAAWRKLGLTVPRIAINVSAHQLRDIDFVGHLTAKLISAEVAACSISIEITESALMQRIEVVRDKLMQLAAMGTKLSVDDFGTGYSSLAYLRKLPLHELKVDRSFVHGIAAERDDRSIAKTIIDMAHALGFRVVAEGVETQAQLEVLRQDGCDIVQGYLFYRPLSSADFEGLLRQPEKISPALPGAADADKTVTIRTRSSAP